eukprot:3400373-Rhodomonas_salina.1
MSCFHDAMSGTDLGYAATSGGAVFAHSTLAFQGIEVRYLPARCPVLALRMATRLLCDARYRPRVSAYTVSGTELAYGATGL